MADKKESKKAEDLIVEMRNTYSRVFSTTDGKRVLKDLLLYCRMHSTTYNSERPNEIYFNEGMRNVALYMISQLEKIDLKEHLKLFSSMEDML